MNRMIVNYSDEIQIENVPFYIQAVINNGRISKSKNGDCYCFCSKFKDGTVCLAEITERGTDTFRLYREE